MIKILSTIDEYMDFVHEINSDPNFSEPMLSSETQMQRNLTNASKAPANKVFGVFDNGEMIGLFVFLILDDESYMEMLVGLSRAEEAYDEILHYLKENYKGYEVDFVYNPHNYLLHNSLSAMKASFEKEQQKLILVNDVEYKHDKEIILYNSQYKEPYIVMHSKDVYWTAEKVLDALDKFRVILAVEDGEVVGYIDITYTSEENEPYDIFVKEEYRGKGYEKAMLAKAIELNKPRGMMLLMDADETLLMEEYESLGFVKSERENSVTAHVLL